MDQGLEAFLHAVPKAELHLHIEGTLEPTMLLGLAERHGLSMPWSTIEEIEAAYRFEDLQSFLDLYYLGASVLRDAEDFHALARAYLERCRDQNVVHLEMMFDPQTHTDRGIAFDVVMEGLLGAVDEARAEWGQSVRLIMCFLRHLDERSALETLQRALPFREHIDAVGLDSGERGNPPEKFARAFAAAREQGYALTAHAGEEGPPAYITGALDTLGVQRIDHGVRCLEDPALVERLVAERIPLTVCPQSNVRLCVYRSMAEHPILEMLERGLSVSVNSDDPAYFGGQLVDNYLALARELDMSGAQALSLVRGSFGGSLLAPAERAPFLAAVDAAAASHGIVRVGDRAS
ncbi:MAG: adenosine deaminase [Pseudomonadales bacterium]|jgi:adenosine deaminase|nr:adenosine deaminase [Pseudomonadales bacterium]